jgi:hypothetical protein
VVGQAVKAEEEGEEGDKEESQPDEFLISLCAPLADFGFPIGSNELERGSDGYGYISVTRTRPT